MKAEHFFSAPLNSSLGAFSHSQSQHQRDENGAQLENSFGRRQRFSGGFGGLSDKDSLCSVNSARGKRIRSRNISMKSSKGITKKSKTMDYTNYAYNEAVGRLKLMLADSYATPKGGGSAYLRNLNEDSTDNYSDNMSVIERPVYSDISRYLSPSQKSRVSSAYRSKKPFSNFSASKENLAMPTVHYPSTSACALPLDYLITTKPPMPSVAPTTVTDSVQAPVEIFNFIEKQEDYIEQLEKESKYCRNELTNLLGKVKDVINENEQLTETARSELAALGGGGNNSKHQHAHMPSPSSDSDEQLYGGMKKSASMTLSTPRNKKEVAIKSPRYASAPNIVYEARISELEAELMQANIDLKRVKTENEDLKRKLAHTDLPLMSASSSLNCEAHRKQIEHLQLDKAALEETIRQLHKSLDDAKSQQYNNSSKRYINDLMQMERSQAELEVKHLRDELDRQHERVRELQHEMARRIADERANAERRYNNQVDQLGGDLSNQWEQVAKLQLEIERQKRYETDMKRDLSNRNSQIDELKMELRSNRSTFLADMAQASAEKQSLEQEINALRLQLDRAAREGKTESSRLNAEISSLRQRLDRGDADLLHSKREVLRLNDEIANLEKELAYGELKNEIRPTKKDLDKRISEMSEKHAETVNELEDMIQSQKQLMDKLTNECKTLTNKLEDTTLKHNQEKKQLRETNEKLMERLKQIWASYKQLNNQLDEERRHSLGDSHSASDATVDIATAKEEHFSQSAPNLIKPLSTTSRPYTVQPTPNVLQPMTTPSHPHTIMSPYSAKRRLPIRSPQPQQQHQPLAPHLHPLTISVASPTMSQPPARSTITSPATIMASTTTTTKISKTIWAKVRSNNSNSSSSSSSNNHNNNNNNKSAAPLPITAPAMPPSPTFTIPIKTMAPASSNRPSRIKTWPPPATTIPTIAPMRATISSSMARAHTMAPTISNSTMAASSSMAATSTMPALMIPALEAELAKAVTAITQPPIMIQPPISTIPQHQQQLLLHPHQHQQLQQPANNSPASSRRQAQAPLQQLRPHLHPHPHPHPHQQPHHPHLARESPRSLLAAQQQKAALNRERAVALWGQQVPAEQSPEENPLCHNSLPRPQPKSSHNAAVLVVGSGAGTGLCATYDPFELEFSISSPSLMRSCDSDTGTEMGDDAAFDSLSDMSISPARTAIRCLSFESGEGADDERVDEETVEADVPTVAAGAQ